ncbi:acyl-[acyl-carrier-protein]-phospholipid O-acyltransferase/long-chain-fatty-acid--[acyl-carrier-protein] ligase [Roseiarcus fermentans]|uniref:Acyl-[acyl-carrier-protein]-phospholipid O-acyltransferase/long-chain-fatty-acid--[acyl-carrier-protein] ligase n=1 Tax=Roseiarcus fermentans TaxID=1473586 RepID=A0A366EVJ1_9HYPH|nr:acyl-[ACP]--phospholipid O-acyltransferase [Roseiarcus fermentans]RBP06421.1 acyl-[acyl-carrier-protein]-phospholipid O-acyltransferase/long-chain-fatty-acid--[acyl-carrier-protein] ligase [Roseiarcus fermentans]
MFGALMTSRRFAPLFWCQFLSAFNDNFVRNMLVMLILFRFGAGDGSLKILLASMVFVLPAIPLSALGGEIADSHDKAAVARRLKLAEIVVQAIAAAGFVFSSLPLLYVALFGLGCIAALFGPIKYGILPDHLRRTELVAGNALVEGATYAAIICGLILGGLAAANGRSSLGIVAQMMLVAFACYATARFIPPTGVGAPGLKVRWNVFASTWAIIGELRADRRSWAAALATSWFWTVGIVALSLVPVIVKARIGGGLDVEIGVNLIFAVGVALGSLAAAALAHGRIELAPAPFLLLVMAAPLIDLGLTTSGLAAASRTVPLAEFFMSPLGLRLAFDLLVFSAAAGLFVVPIFAAIQAWAGEDRRARVTAAVNALNYLMMVAGSLATMILLELVRLSEPATLVLLGLANLVAAALAFRSLPANPLAFLARLALGIVYRLEVVGADNLPRPDDCAVIAVNHVSFLDAVALTAVMEQAPLLAVDRIAARRGLVKPLLGILGIAPMDPARPLTARALVGAARAGRALAVFPEGRTALTPMIMRDYAALSLMIEKTGALVTPVRIEGAERTLFSRLDPAHVGRRLFPKIRLTVLPPRRLAVPRAANGRARRRAAGAALVDLMADVVFETTDIRRTLHAAFEAQVRRTGVKRIVVEDPLAGPMTVRMFRIGIAVLARKIAALSAPGETVGLMLPNANGAVVTFMALQAAGRVAALLNFTAGPANLVSACRTAEIRLVLTSRAFVEKADLGPVIEAIAEVARIVWLEDVRAGATARDKLTAALTAGRALTPRAPDDPAAVLFTSGTEGAPKGVALSHANILANVAQIDARYDLRVSDIVFNPLPMFHAFGLSAGTLLGLMTSMRVSLYPTPLHYRQIPDLIDRVGATVLFGTDTFLTGWARNAAADGFRSLRYVIAGAEALKPETRRVYQEKFGLQLFEGYGVTEAAPVLAVNAPMFNRIGTVGRLLPHIRTRIVPVPGIEEGGRLLVKGPNVMVGYYRADNPGELEPPAGGWHDTGDIVAIDAEGFVAIKGRAKRFAKLAGELISLAAIEDLLWGLWPEDAVACVAAPDAKRGERVILATTHRGAAKAEVDAWMKIKGAAPIMAPASVVVLDAIPLLGSGKVDYVALVKALRERGA